MEKVKMENEVNDEVKKPVRKNTKRKPKVNNMETKNPFDETTELMTVQKEDSKVSKEKKTKVFKKGNLKIKIVKEVVKEENEQDEEGNDICHNDIFPKLPKWTIWTIGTLAAVLILILLFV